jgi:hypothetical protein
VTKRRRKKKSKRKPPLPAESRQNLGRDPQETAYYNDNAEQWFQRWSFDEPGKDYWQRFPKRVVRRLSTHAPAEKEDILAPPAPEQPREAERAAPTQDLGTNMLAALAGRSTLASADNFFDEQGPFAGTAASGRPTPLSSVPPPPVAEFRRSSTPPVVVAEAPGAPRPEAIALATAPVASAPAKGLYYVVAGLTLALCVMTYLALRPAGGRDEGATVAEAASPPPVAAVVPASARVVQASSGAPAVAAVAASSASDLAEPASPAPAAEETLSSGGEAQTAVEEQPASAREAETASAPVQSSASVAQARTARVEPSRRAAARRPVASSPPAAPATASAPQPRPEPAAARTAPAQPKRAVADLDQLLVGATGGPGGGPSGLSEARAAVDSAVGSGGARRQLPAQPSRAQVRRAMGAVAGDVMACRALADSQVRLNATVRVANNGTVRSAVVAGPGSAALRQCVQQAVSGARFPEFSQPSFSVTYPFVLSPPQ